MADWFNICVKLYVLMVDSNLVQLRLYKRYKGYKQIGTVLRKTTKYNKREQVLYWMRKPLDLSDSLPFMKKIHGIWKMIITCVSLAGVEVSNRPMCLFIFRDTFIKQK